MTWQAWCISFGTTTCHMGMARLVAESIALGRLLQTRFLDSGKKEKNGKRMGES